LQVLAAMMEADLTGPGGPKIRHDTERSATRHGHRIRVGELEGRRGPERRPSRRATDAFLAKG